MSRAQERDDDELIRLRRENVALRSEIEEFHRRDGDIALELEKDRRHHVAALFIEEQFPSQHRRGAARVLVLLLRSAGRLVRTQELALVATLDPEASITGGTGNTKVYISTVRSALRAWGLPEAITTHWARGYSLDKDDAKKIAAELERRVA